MMPADSTAESINTALADGDPEWAFKMLIQGRDHLRLLLDEPGDAVTVWEARKTAIDDVRYDALLRAVVAHVFIERGRSVPGWATPRRLDEPWILANPLLGPEHTIAQAPPWLADLNIFIADRDLSTA